MVQWCKPEDEQGKFIVFKEDALYVNSGFTCPAEQNIETINKDEHKMPTFSEITVDRSNQQFSTSVYQSEKDADGNYHISPVEGPRTVPFKK